MDTTKKTDKEESNGEPSSGSTTPGSNLLAISEDTFAALMKAMDIVNLLKMHPRTEIGQFDIRIIIAMDRYDVLMEVARVARAKSLEAHESESQKTPTET